jgi:hypothetical protein
MGWITSLLDRIERIHLFTWLVELASFFKWPKLVTAAIGGIGLAAWTWLDQEPWSIVVLSGLLTALSILIIIAIVIFIHTHWQQSRRGNLRVVLELRPSTSLYGTTGECIYWGVRNNSRKTTVYDVTLRAKDSWFTRAIIAPTQDRRVLPNYGLEPLPINDIEPIVAKFTHVDPLATETTKAIVLTYSKTESRNPHDILSTIQRFSLEARAKDEKTEIAMFEYNPDARPMIKKIS